jgi:hypothetical protein
VNTGWTVHKLAQGPVFKSLILAYDKTMKETTPSASALVLQALVQLNEMMRDNDAFAGYNDDEEGTARLLEELWKLQRENSENADVDPDFPVQPYIITTPEELVDAWFNEIFEMEMEIN